MRRRRTTPRKQVRSVARSSPPRCPQLPHPITELEGGVVAEEICSGRGSPAVGPGELGDARQVAVLRARTTLFSGVSVVLYLAVVVKTHL